MAGLSNSTLWQKHRTWLGRRAILLETFILLVFVFACELPSFETQDPGAISTAAAQTVLAGLTQKALLVPFSPTAPEPTLTITPEPPTVTATETMTATLVFTATPVVPQISVSVDTNCRSGPGKVYQMEGALLVGEVAQVYGRDPTGRYWYIHNPDAANEFCWVWGEYATLNGTTSFLPVYTPPPTPTPTRTPTPTFTPTPLPDFEASYNSLETCTGWWVNLKITNIGTVSFKSVGITAKDPVTDIVLVNFADGFVHNNGCLASAAKNILKPGKAHIISTPAFNYNPSGHKLQVKIILCSNTGLNGTCVTKTIKFKP